MSLRIKMDNTFTESQQKEIISLCNKAYDRGGADVLKLILFTADNLAKETPELEPYNRFVQVLVEGIRSKLNETVSESLIREEQEKPLIKLA